MKLSMVTTLERTRFENLTFCLYHFSHFLRFLRNTVFCDCQVTDKINLGIWTLLMWSYSETAIFFRIFFPWLLKRLRWITNRWGFSTNVIHIVWLVSFAHLGHTLKQKKNKQIKVRYCTHPESFAYLMYFDGINQTGNQTVAAKSMIGKKLYIVFI